MPGVVDAEINDKGELILIYQDGTEQNLGVVVGKDGSDGVNGEDGALVIDGYESVISAASARGLRSAVSIVSNFKATVQQGGWRPGYGSTTTKEYSSAGSGVIYQLDKDEGDVLLSATVNSEKTDITRQYHIIDMMLDVRVGDVVALEFLRGNEKSTVQITITEDCLTAY